MDNDEEFDLIDLIAFNCTTLVEAVSATENEAEKRKLILKFLQDSDEREDKIADFKADLDWFNVTEPLSLADSLKGKVVILDFFTYCCINCMHILPDLKHIEELYTPEDGLVVVGVHSPKFDNEKDSANILSAIQRYGITHPIVNDSNSSMWMDIKIKCWPTLLILGPNANPLFVLMGEGHGAILEKYIKVTLDFYKKKGALSTSSLPISPSTELTAASNLKFPGKIASWRAKGPASDLFAISDSGNNRVLIVNASGEVTAKVGGTHSGFIDGNFENARFNSPQGVTFLSEDVVIVADTENHAIRMINLKANTVETLVGNGKQGTGRVGGNIGTNQEISSPWDVAVYKTRDMDMSFHVDEENIPEKNVILIAMAGNHQIWGLFPDGMIWWKFKKFVPLSCAAIVGNGMEENRNNSYPQNAAFAQPSGLAIAKEFVFVADSESSSVRKVSLLDGKVMPVVGGDRNPLNLFAYGDIDGKQYQAKLQHPLGVAYNDVRDELYVADTYNHKIKRINIVNNVVETLAIKDARGTDYQFNEPAGLCVDATGDRLFVADTNNHIIQIVDLKTLETHPWKLKFSAAQAPAKKFKHAVILKYNPVRVSSAGTDLQLLMRLVLADGLKFTPDAPQLWKLDLPHEKYQAKEKAGTVSEQSFLVNLIVPKTNAGITQEVEIACKLSVCLKDLCFPKNFNMQVPLTFEETAEKSLTEEITVHITDKDIRF